ncbi:hypothetical protein [Mesorhizobium sp. BR1-1-4]|uniref:hypothetical protein n=1 Tax=Mesorhizobium sp. BR1-1-4 TaxID=2876650 RepID=UPI001CCDDB3B|nr:hypothetical protein [Mesorhizobium sp. BR1-1-4]MBZ9926794.1 hypothetical protein [Mesorhizobium sp. BR1-1-4]
MTLFAILFEPDNEPMAAYVRETFPAGFSPSPGQYLIQEDGVTSVQLAERVGQKGERGKFVIFAVDNYWGWHSKTLWEWLKANAKS